MKNATMRQINYASNQLCVKSTMRQINYASNQLCVKSTMRQPTMRKSTMYNQSCVKLHASSTMRQNDASGADASFRYILSLSKGGLWHLCSSPMLHVILYMTSCGASCQRAPAFCCCCSKLLHLSSVLGQNHALFWAHHLHHSLLQL